MSIVWNLDRAKVASPPCGFAKALRLADKLELAGKDHYIVIDAPPVRLCS